MMIAGLQESSVGHHIDVSGKVAVRQDPPVLSDILKGNLSQINTRFFSSFKNPQVVLC